MTSRTTTTTGVAEIMARNVITIRPEASVAEAAGLLSRHRFTGAPVVDAVGGLVGVVSESDIIGKQGATVSDIMTPAIHTVDETATVAEVAETLLLRQIRRVPVVRDGQLVGLVSRSDLIDFYAQHQWVCSWCSRGYRGLQPPVSCDGCSGDAFRLDRIEEGG
ncbi:MAG: CBS domain-containing protein [Candidatus Dormibacteria bacterium]